MKIFAHEAEENAVLHIAELMCSAARTAPKTRGIDKTVTLILTGEDKDAVADKMEEILWMMLLPFKRNWQTTAKF